MEHDRLTDETRYGEGYSDGYLAYPTHDPASDDGDYAEGYTAGQEDRKRALAEEQAFDESPRSALWTLPRLSEIAQMDRHEVHRHQQEISSTHEARKTYGNQALIGPPRYEPGGRERWLEEQEAREG